MGIGSTKGGLRRRMPLRRAGGPPSTGTSRLGGRAMRYYRLWIYTCNTALLAGTIAFCGAAGKTFLFDFRRMLVPSITLYQPSFLYGYLALIIQGGALQLLGCIAALRLSEKLLNAYWLLLLVLLFGDVVLGAFWTYKFERICHELKPVLKMHFIHNYGTNTEFTILWNRLQKEETCCGINGPEEFGNNSNSYWGEMPESCCSETIINGTNCAKSYTYGCTEKLIAYLRATASILAILGYCVLAFLKLCFLGILRYEIKEMIQKIRLLKAELETTNINGTVMTGPIRAETVESERESLLVKPESAALLSSSPPTQSKTVNGNNNYEMREYRSHQNI